MRVLRLFDGISCGQLALQRANINVENYYASEIDKYAIQIAKKNFPNTIHIGDVNEIDFREYIGKIDILIGGSPCTELSIANKGGLGLEGSHSMLFWKYVDALNIIKPKYFFLENVASMKKSDKNIITQTLGVESIEINSSLFSAQNRRRLYWTNIPNVVMPQDKGILLKDIVLSDVEPIVLHNIYGGFKEEVVRVFEEKSPTIRTSRGGGHIPSFVKKDLLHNPKAIEYMDRATRDGRNHWDFGHHSDVRKDKSSSVVANFFKGVPYNVFKDWDCIRKFHPIECERLQTLESNEINLEVELCLDQAKNYVNVVKKSPKLQKLVLNAEKNSSKEFVNFVAMNTNVSHLLTKYIVQQNADMQTQMQIEKCTNHKQLGLNLNANNVENYMKFQNQKKMVSSVQLNVLENIIEGKITHCGEVDSLQKESLYIQKKNGKISLKLYGKEIMQLAEDVERSLITKRDNSFTYTILNLLGLKNLEQMLTICYFYAKSVIDGHMENQTQRENLLTNFYIGYTEYGLDENENLTIISPTQRYKMIGNGWTIDVVAYIFGFIPKEEKE